MSMQNVFDVPIAKGGDKAFIKFDVSVLKDEDYALVMAEGLKAIANARMSKVGAVTKLTGKDLADANAKAMATATENLDKLVKGETKVRGKSASKSDIPREVQTEARRQAREVVRNEIRRAGLTKVSQYAASDITKAADILIANDPSYIEKARATLAARADLSAGIDISTIIKADPKKVEAARVAKANKPLSKTQAGIVAPRRKPVTQAPAAVH